MKIYTRRELYEAIRENTDRVTAKKAYRAVIGLELPLCYVVIETRLFAVLRTLTVRNVMATLYLNSQCAAQGYRRRISLEIR